MKLEAARARYYDANHFGADGGDALAWVPVKLGPITVKIPNTDGRRRAVQFHDVHHIVTGYQTDLRGESEIAAWELATGCTRWPAATVLNLAGLALGVIVWPRKCARAWALGRHTKNLYREPDVSAFLDREVEDVRRELGLGLAKVPVRIRDVASLLGFLLAAPFVIVRSLLSA